MKQDLNTQKEVKQKKALFLPSITENTRAVSVQPTKKILKNTKLDDSIEVIASIDQNIQSPSPKRLLMSQNRLSDEKIVSLKYYRELNSTQKMKIQTLEKELSLVQSNTGQNLKQSGNFSEQKLILRLQKDLANQKLQNKSLEDQLINFKRSVQHFRLQELESENKSFAEETQRLRVLLEQIAKKKDSYIQQIIQNRANFQIPNQLTYFQLTEQLETLMVSKELAERQIDNLKKSMKDIKLRNILQERELQQMRLAQRKKVMDDEEQGEKQIQSNEIMQNIEEIQAQQIKKKDQIINYQERTIADLRIKQQSLQDKYTRDTSNLKTQIEQQQAKYYDVDAKYKALIKIYQETEANLQQQQNSPAKRKQSIEINSSPIHSRSLLRKMTEIDVEPSKIEVIPKIYKSVKLNQIQKLIKTIKYYLIGKKIAQDDMIEKIFGSQNIKQGDQITIDQMLDVLTSMGFSDQDDCLNLARYFIEDQDQPPHQLDLQQSNRGQAVFSIFKKCIGKYTLPNYENLEQNSNELKRILSMNANIMTLQEKIQKRIGTKDYCPVQEIMVQLADTLPDVNQDWSENILIEVIGKNMHIDRLDLNEFCFIFGNIPRPEQKEESPVDSPYRKKKLDKNSLTVDTGNKISLKEQIISPDPQKDSDMISNSLKGSQIINRSMEIKEVEQEQEQDKNIQQDEQLEEEQQE